MYFIEKEKLFYNATAEVFKIVASVSGNAEVFKVVDPWAFEKYELNMNTVWARQIYS